jgi:hypothetical protein
MVPLPRGSVQLGSIPSAPGRLSPNGRIFGGNGRDRSLNVRPFGDDVQMPTAHLYIFSDACPTDWLTDGHDKEWHTIVNLVFQSDPALHPLVDRGESHQVVLGQDAKYLQLVRKLQSQLPSSQLRKWKAGPRYRRSFCNAFAAIVQKHRPIVSACSFQEETLRASRLALMNSYNRRIGGIEGRGIGFEEFMDGKGRPQMKHSFVNFYGYHEIQAPVSQMLVLLLMSWFVADQYVFFCNHIVRNGRYGFDNLKVTVVSDKLSGDDDFRRRSELNLRNLIDPHHECVPVVLTRSPVSDTFSGDLFVDNLAGWLNAAMTDPAGDYATFARNLMDTDVWTGWHHLVPSTTELRAAPAKARLT